MPPKNSRKNHKESIMPKGGIVIYKTSDRLVQLEVKFEKETVWLSQKQIAELFGTQRPAITKHLNNIFATKELDKKSVCSILEHTAADGKAYQIEFYNLFGGIVTNSDPRNYTGRWVYFDRTSKELRDNDFSNWINLEI